MTKERMWHCTAKNCGGPLQVSIGAEAGIGSFIPEGAIFKAQNLPITDKSETKGVTRTTWIFSQMI